MPHHEVAQVARRAQAAQQLRWTGDPVFTTGSGSGALLAAAGANFPAANVSYGPKMTAIYSSASDVLANAGS